MKKLAILLLVTTAVYADNTDAFNNAYQIGKQNQFNLNLNSGSTFDSFGQANKFESNIINDAKTGNANAQPMYNGATNDPNYLYNQGKADIASCQSKNDPRCTSLNKYGDKDTQTQFQAYNQGISGKYSIITKPDPSDKNCTQVIKKVPIGEATKTCIASAHQQSQCHSTISISLAYHDCNPKKNECNSWQSNPECKLVKPFIAGKCNYDCDSSYNKGSSAYCPYWEGAYVHDNNWVSGRCNIGDTYYASAVKQTITCGTRIGGTSPNWHVEFNACTDNQLATYACKVYSYSDGCKGFKQ